MLWNCAECERNFYQYPEPNCLSGGRYCAPDPDGVGPKTGRDVVIEDLRQLCIHKLTEGAKDYKAWFRYMSHYDPLCENVDECIQNTIKLSGLDEKKINKCMDDSFDGYSKTISDNSILREERIA